MKAQRKMLFSQFYVQFTMLSKVQNMAILFCFCLCKEIFVTKIYNTAASI